MMISRSFAWKAVATVGAAVGFVFVYETTVPDSRDAVGQAASMAAAPRPGARLRFTATAYCKGQTTASGVGVRTGIAAADPTLLPVGTVVRIDTADPKLDGIWTVMDTGPAVQGRTVDLYMWSCHEALRFGRRSIGLEVLRLGWNPQNSEPARVTDLFRKREIQKARTTAQTQKDSAKPGAADVVPAVQPLPVPPPH